MQKEKRAEIGKIILKTIAVAGLLSMIVLAPNTLQALDMFYDRRKRKYNTKYYVKKTITRLKDQGLIEFVKKNNKTFVRLTSEGEERLLKYQLGEAVIKKPKEWDGKWRIIIFDIKEEKRVRRNLFREELRNLGFLRLQNSVWVHPYECEEIVIILKAYFCLGKDVLYITAEKIENDKWFKKEFGLIKNSD